MSVPRPPGTVLIIDDERNIVDLLRSYFEAEGFRVLDGRDGLEGLSLAQQESPEAIILDVMMPGLDGIETLRRIRQFSDAHVIMLTARTEEADKLVGLAVGADDYVSKPFSPREVVARVRAALRRRSGAFAEEGAKRLRALDLVIDEERFEVKREGTPVVLTPTEFKLLAALAGSPGRVFTRDQLLERVWGDSHYDPHLVDVHVQNVRKKLGDDPADARYVETVRGIGYRFKVE